VVDVANVMGARADGWWRDRAGAAARLCSEIAALAGRGIGADQAERSFPSYVLVLEGQARAAAVMIENEMIENETIENETIKNETIKNEMIDNVPPRVRVLSAAGSGDDTIVEVVAEIVEILAAAAEDASCLVVTADRELRQRCAALGAAVAGPGWLLALL
jgi:8-oxo-dGTP diphosphatase